MLHDQLKFGLFANMETDRLHPNLLINRKLIPNQGGFSESIIRATI